MIDKGKMRMFLWVCLSWLLLTNTFQPIQAQDATPTDAATEETIPVIQALEAANEQELQSILEPGPEEPVPVGANRPTEGENSPDGLTNRLFLPLIQEGAAETDVGEIAEVVAASQQLLWSPSCLNVLNTERGLWDDMPSVGVSGGHNKAGLFWILTNTNFDEKCSYTVSADNIATNAFPSLQVRVAVNDGARFTVAVYDNEVAPCAHPVAIITTGALRDNSQFYTYPLNLPANKTICKVKIALDDDPNNDLSTRASALIDYVRIWNPVTGAIKWNESFFTPPPECQTAQLQGATELTQPADKPYWQFVLNFDIWQGNQPLACVLLYHIGDRRPFDAISFLCDLLPGVARIGTQVEFDGGYVQCHINLKERFAALGDPFMRLDEMYLYPGFTIAGAGKLDAAGSTPDPLLSNPIVVYQPLDSSHPPVGLFTPWYSPTKLQIVSSYGFNETHRCPFVTPNPPPSQRWYMRLGGGTINYWLDNQQGLLALCSYRPLQQQVPFWTTGGSFFVGGLPTDPPENRLHGQLDEVLIDPTGSTKPPA